MPGNTPESANAVMAAIDALGTPTKATANAWFFKSGPGQYGAGDRFVGVTVPAQRSVAKRFREIPLSEIDRLADSPIHEHRLTGVLIAVEQYRAAVRHEDTLGQRQVVDWFIAAALRGRINNWDIVDTSAAAILGSWLIDRPRDLLFEWATCENLWLRRIAMIATLAFLTRGDGSTTIALLPLYLDTREDLLQKATGWMLRELGKRVGRAQLLDVLEEYAARMPRTMLSYATEHLSADQRRHFRSLTA